MTGDKRMFSSYVKNKDPQDSIIFGDGNQVLELARAARRPTRVNGGDEQGYVLGGNSSVI
jgi:hypothetical protein